MFASTRMLNGEPDTKAGFTPRSPPPSMLDRRQFLGVAATGVAISLAGATRVAHGADAESEPRAHAPSELLAALGTDAVREIGQAYRVTVPAEHDRATLEAALRAELRAADFANEDPIRADFAAGRVIVVRDWMLSRTEARQCALFSLLPA
jgi:hypothetical protein